MMKNCCIALSLLALPLTLAAGTVGTNYVEVGGGYANFDFGPVEVDGSVLDMRANFALPESYSDNINYDIQVHSLTVWPQDIDVTMGLLTVGLVAHTQLNPNVVLYTQPMVGIGYEDVSEYDLDYSETSFVYGAEVGAVCTLLENFTVGGLLGWGDVTEWEGDSDTFYYGINVAWAFSQHFAVRSEVTDYKDLDLMTATASVTYTF